MGTQNESKMKGDAKKLLSNQPGYAGIGWSNNKVIVYVDNLDSECAKTKLPNDLINHVQFKVNQRSTAAV